MKQEKIKIVRGRVGKVLEVDTIDNTLESLQCEVDGYIEFTPLSAYYPYEILENVEVCCNEEGLIRNLPFNRGLHHNNELITGLCGDIVFVALDKETGENIDLTREQIIVLFELFCFPEVLVKINNNILSVPMNCKDDPVKLLQEQLDENLTTIEFYATVANAKNN